MSFLTHRFIVVSKMLANTWQKFCTEAETPLLVACVCVCVVLCCVVMRPKAGLIVGKQTCGSFNLLYTTIRPIIGLASREYKHRMLATADTTAISALCLVQWPGPSRTPFHRCTFYFKSEIRIRNIKHDGESVLYSTDVWGRQQATLTAAPHSVYCVIPIALWQVWYQHFTLCIYIYSRETVFTVDSIEAVTRRWCPCRQV